MISMLKDTLKQYIGKTWLLSELTVCVIFIYVFIYKVSPYTWGLDTFLIDLNVAIIFSCLLSAYRLFVYEGKTGKQLIENYGKTRYYLSKILITLFSNIIILAIFSIYLYFTRLENNEIILYSYSLIPVLFNILLGTATGVFFSPVVLSIHQVIHGIFIIVVGINMTAISSFFSGSLINYLFKVLMFLFPPIEQTIALSLSPVLNTGSIITILWSAIYSGILLWGGKKIIEKKEIKYKKDDSISFD